MELSANPPEETFVDKVNDFCTIVDRGETKVVGIKIHFSPESRGELTDFGTNNIRSVAKKYITNGTVRLIADIIGEDDPQIIGIRTDNEGDGVYDFTIGVVVETFDNIPEYLPEYSVCITCPPCRYARMEINERKLPDRHGYDEQMRADEYFIGDFRKDTAYVYDKSGIPFNTFDINGDFIAKYEPVKVPKDEAERFDSFVFRVVSLPDILVACSTQGPGDNDFVIFKYFGVQNKIFPLDCAKMYNDDYYGFPADIGGVTYSCFGSRVSSFDALPDCVEKMTIKGGLYLHISQLEFNGDNPSMAYDVAFNHLDELFLNDNPLYTRDNSKHVIARFRQANCASVLVPLLLRR